jgi:predicted esterase
MPRWGVRIVLLHGHGSSPDQLAIVADAIAACLTETEIVCPSGSIKLADDTFAWFDDPFSGVVSGGPTDASVAVASLTALADLDLHDAVVCGFSQGGALAVALGFLAGQGSRPRAVVSVCGFLPERVDVRKVGHATLLVTGDDDEIVDPFYSESLSRQMKKLDCDVTLATVSTGHAWTPEVTKIVVEWLQRLQ